MLSSDILKRLNVTDPVLEIVDKEVRPMLKMLTGDDPNAMTMMMINLKIRSMLNNVVPGAKATLYALGMAKLFILEIGPLVTALLLSGRIGGSYAGEVATMQATAQNNLLKTLGISPRLWTLGPALLAALIASPLLTTIGTAIAIYLGGLVGPSYGIGTFDQYFEDIRRAVFPTLRLRSIVAWEGGEYDGYSVVKVIQSLDLRCSVGNSSLWETVVEILTYPPFFLFAKATFFMTIIMLVSESAARISQNLTPRSVPGVITRSVVLSSLLIIVADWGFSQLLLKRQY
jgi:ABC-type transporter Mla maintaining outer membrane lipid asymmetry permease subunit MlaE